MRVCPFRDCGRSIHETLFSCAAHWRGMTKPHRDRVYACYRDYKNMAIGVEELRAIQAQILTEADPCRRPTMAEPTVRPFSNGSQYGDWTDSNCASCSKAAKPETPGVMPCEIELALLTACFGEGTIPLPMADRMGHGGRRYNWPCLEHDPPFANVRPDGTVDPSIKKPE